MPPAHQRLQIEGTLSQADGGGSEIFSFGMALASGMSPQEAATAAAGVVHDFFTDNPGQDLMGSSTFVRGVRVEAVQVDGSVSSSYYVSVGSIQGLAGYDACTILSMAVTLETSTAGGRGRMVRGRFYPPATMQPKGSTVTLGNAETWANGWAGLVNGLNDVGLNVSVASSTSGGQIAPVTGVSVDTVVDTIRRRKNHVTSQRSPIVAVPGS